MSLAGQLYRLEQIDLELQRKREELSSIESMLSNNRILAAAESEVASKKKELEEARRKQKNCEWELDDLQEKLRQIEGKLYGGGTRNPKELVNLERELKALKSNIKGKEDELLEFMAQREELEAKVRVSSEQLERLKREWEQKREELEGRRRQLQSEVARLAQNREELVQRIDGDTLEFYRRLKLHKGQVVAKVELGKCQGCHISLPTSQWQKARAGEVVQCNSCGRILYVE